ncbi:MAG: hypothetical protein GY953_08240, partial [bacterium]|nr:hypothetical protein [bacterium]
YANQRRAFGKTIGEFGLIQGKLGQMAIQIYGLVSELSPTKRELSANGLMPKAPTLCSRMTSNRLSCGNLLLAAV